MTQYVMGVDQYGNRYNDLGEHPKNKLLEILGAKATEKMYIDKKDKKSWHVGYIIKGLWITLYYVTPWEKNA